MKSPGSSIGQQWNLDKVNLRSHTIMMRGSADEGDDVSLLERRNDVSNDSNLSQAYLALGVLVLTFASNQWARQAIYYLCNFGPDAEQFKHMNLELNFNKEMYATLASLGFTVVFALTSLFAGGASDKYDRGKVIALSCFGWSLCTALQSRASSFTDLLLLRALVGFTQAFFNPAAYTLLGDLFPQRLIGTVNGIFSGGVYLGGALASLSILLDDKYGWKGTVNAIGLIGFGAAALNVLLNKDPLRAGKKAVLVEAENKVKYKSNVLEDGLEAIKEVTATKEARLLLMATAFRFCAGFSIAIWKAPFIFSKFPGVAEQFSRSNAAIVAGGGLISTLLGGLFPINCLTPKTRRVKHPWHVRGCRPSIPPCRARLGCFCPFPHTRTHGDSSSS